MPQFKALLDGYRRFRAGPYVEQRQRYDALANKGQAPKVMVIACADSRVDPTRVFDATPGQMFVLRNVAALVPPYEPGGGQHGASAAIEYAVTQLEVDHILVFGHAQCGGIQASLDGRFDAAPEGRGGFIGAWMSMIAAERDRVRAAAAAHPDLNAQEMLELAAIRVSLDHLLSFPFVADRVAAGTLGLQGAHFGIADGGLRVLDRATDQFVPVAISLSADTTG